MSFPLTSFYWIKKMNTKFNIINLNQIEIKKDILNILSKNISKYGINLDVNELSEKLDFLTVDSGYIEIYSTCDFFSSYLSANNIESLPEELNLYKIIFELSKLMDDDIVIVEEPEGWEEAQYDENGGSHHVSKIRFKAGTGEIMFASSEVIFNKECKIIDLI